MKLCLPYFVPLFLTLTECANSLNILGIFPYQGKSHFFVHRAYLRELANRGHNVTVISHFPESDPRPNYHDISLAGSIKVVKEDFPVESSYWAQIKTIYFILAAGKQNCEVMLANKNVQRLVNEKLKFDVIVVEQFNSDCALGLAYKLEAPVVGMTSNVLLPFQYKRFGIPNNPSFLPNVCLGGGTKPTLYQRVEGVVLDAFFRSLYYLLTQRSNQRTLANYFDNMPPLEDLARDIKFLLVYQNFILTGSRLFPANVIEVGGYHIAQAKPLTGDLKKFIEEAEYGVIYISFGSVLKSTTMPADKLDAVLETIKELPQRFILKWKDNTLKMDKNKLYISDWLPQFDILGHPKTIAFMSHAGMASTTEAIHYGVPVVAIPVLGDQPSNAAAIAESGLGVQLQISDINKEYLLKAFTKVLDPKFHYRVKQVSKAWHDRPMSAMDTAIYWTEFAARHSNFTFRTAAADVPLYQYINLDIAAIFISVFILFILSLFKCIKAICDSKIENHRRRKSKRE